jgi:hypothetical protein
MPETDDSATLQQQLLAVQHELALAVERHIGFVDARVDERELVAAALDARMQPRCPPVLDDDVVLLIAAERDG